MHTRATALLLSYQRKENLHKIISGIRKQTVPIDIFLWNNNPQDKTEYPVDLQINSSQNLMCLPRWFMANFARTEYVFSMDDDLLFVDDEVIADCMDYIEAHNYDAIGYHGVQINDINKSYKDQDHVCSVAYDKNVDILKGGFLFTKQQNIILPRNHFRADIYNPRIEDDIIISSVLERKAVPAMLNKRFRMLSGFQNGLHAKPDHYASRTKYMQKYYE